ncbi:hypothetical protein NQD34_018230 [Periophthalmus magnuspinnatus]|nr:hypothetical protein NQD34_018230 [Periophthalmus magnuspinnatus]
MCLYLSTLSCLQRPLPLITPYKWPVQGVGAQRFNFYHSKARSIIERAFGMMKTRFRAIFFHALEVHHTFAPHVITACAVLHNICLGAGDIVALEDEPQENVVEDEGDNEVEAVAGAQWTSCLLRSLPWRRCSWIIIISRFFDSDMPVIYCPSQPCKPSP